MSDSAKRQPLNSATRAVLVNRLPEPHQQPQFNRNLAVIIGIDAYANGVPRLTTAVNDAARLADLLRDAHGYETILLTEPATGQPVTRARLAALFVEEMPARLGEDDRLLVYFAGHGVALDGDDGPRGYLVPQDAKPGDSASMLAMTDLHAWLTALPCRHMLVILDCCFAGAFRWAATRHLGALPDVIYKERYDRYLRSPAWQVLTSAAYDQKALDVLNGKAIGVRESDGKGHSPFAQALIDALEKGEADLVPKGQGDGVITATELYLYLRQQVEVQAEEQASHEQTPGLWPLNKHGKGEFIFLAPGHPLNLPPAPDLTTELNPYRGLKSYDQEHAPLFFGREDEIKELVALVEQQPFLAVLGASGTGKSSLVKAGVLPRLEVRSDDFSRPAPAEATEVATTNEAYRVLPPMRPTDHPVQALDALLRAVPDFRSLGDFGSPDGGDDALAQVIARWAEGHPNERLVLTIDQFEELATLCRDDAERERFLRLLASAVEQQPAAFRLIITLRTDFEPQFTQEGSPLANLWQSARLAEPPARYIVPPMDIEDLRQVIEGPAAVRVLYFDPPELVDDLIKEVIQTPGALPLLSFTLSELYVKYIQSGRDDRALSGADYQALGGVIGSLRKRASEEYDALPDDAHRATMQRAMLRMVAVEGGELARRRVALSELDYPTKEENARVQTVLDRLVEARLLVRGTSDNSDGSKGEAYIEPAHDALVLAWDKLLRWKKEAEEYLPLQRRLAQAATEWSKAAPEAKAGLLWDDDPRLPQVEETLWPTNGRRSGLAGRFRWGKQVLLPDTTAPGNTRWLNEAELSFVQTSVRARARFWQRTVGIALAVLVLLSGLTIFANIQRQVANVQRDNAVKAEQTAEARRIEAERNAAVARARELSAQSQAVADTNPAVSTLLAVEAVAATNHLDSSFGEVRVPAAEQRVLDVLLKPTGQLLGSHESAVVAMLAAPDGRLLVVTASPAATANTNSMTYQLWTIHGDDVQSRTLLADQEQLAHTPVLSPDGRWLAVQTPSDGLSLWDTRDPVAEPITLLSGAVLQGKTVWIQFSPDGRWVTTNFDERFWLWDTHQADVAVFEYQEDIVGSEFSQDGRWLVTNPAIDSSEIRLLLWDLAGQVPTHYVLVEGDGVAASEIVFSGETHRLAMLSSDGTLTLWNTEKPNEEPVILAEWGYPYWDFYPGGDGRSFVARPFGGGSSLYLLTFTAAGAELTELKIATEHGGGQVIYLPEKDRLLTTDWQTGPGKITLSHPSNPDQPPRMLAEGVRELSLFPDGRRLLIAREDGDTRLWDLANPDLAPQLLYRTVIKPLGFSPDSRWLVTSHQSAVQLWDTDRLDADPVLLTGHEGQVRSTAFSGDSRWLVTDGPGGARLWDMKDLAALPDHNLRYHTGGVKTLAFSPDGAWLGSGSADATARLTNLEANFAHLVLSGFAGEASAVAFSPDGKWVATGSQDTLVRIWRMDDLLGAPLTLQGGGSVTALAFSPDSRSLAAGHYVGEIWMWDMQELDKEPLLLRGTAGWIYFLAFSPDGRWLVSTGQTGAVAHVWDLQASPPAFHALQDSVADSAKAGAVSPDGQWLATASSAGKQGKQVTHVLLWDYRTPGSPPKALATSEVVQDGMIAYSVDGRWLAAADRSNRIYLWDTTDLDADPLLLRGHDGPIYALAFDPKQRWLATGGEDATIRLWDLSMTHLLEQACHSVGRNLAWQEWDQYFPQEAVYHTTCPAYAVHSSVIQRYLDEGDMAWQAGDRETALTRFRQAAAWDPSINLTQVLGDANAKAQQRLINEGQLLARQGDMAAAFARFDQAASLDATTPVGELRAEAQAVVFHWLVDTGTQLLERNLIQQAVDKLTEGAALSLTLQADQIEEIRLRQEIYQEDILLLDLASKKDPAAAARSFASAYLLQLGRKVWGWPKSADDTPNIGYAIEKIELAKSLDPALDLDPANEAKRSLIEYWLDGVESVTDSGGYSYYAARVQNAVDLADPALDLPAELWNVLCWYGSLYGFAVRVADGACEKAVVLADAAESPSYRDSRGLARALTGDSAGAFSDFQSFIDRHPGRDATLRQAWIRRLQAGEPSTSVFDANTLLCLISDSCNQPNLDSPEVVEP